MKFAPSAARREGRIERLRRGRATSQVLCMAFPALQQLCIEMRFQGSTSCVPSPQSHVLYPPARAFFEYRCPYADCDGQFDLGGAVNAALADPTYHAHGILECSGSRPGVDHNSRRPCLLQLAYEVTATYREQS